MNHRRKFIYQAGVGLVAIPFVMSCKSNESKTVEETMAEKVFELDNFGIQVYSVRDAMAEDAKRTLRQLSEFGYYNIESFDGGNGIFWGMTPKEYKTFLDDNGLVTWSTHSNPRFTTDESLLDEAKELLDGAAEVGIKYVINPWMAYLKTGDEFKRATDGLNKMGELCNERGLRYAYHNHAYSFKQTDDILPQAYMMDNTEGNVDFEMDIYWVVDAGADPVEWIKKYPNRFKLSHVKDRYPQSRVDELIKTEGEGNFSCNLGTGSIDFNAVLQVAKDNGMEYYIVEQERYDNSTSMNSAKENANYMKKFVG